MPRVTLLSLAVVICLVSLFAPAAIASEETPATATTAPLMTKEELKPMLGQPDLIVIDVRLDFQRKGDTAKIKGAILEYPGLPIESWLTKYPKDKTLVLY